MLLEEVLRDLDVDAGAVARLAVGVHRTAMPDRLQRLDALQHDLPAPLAVPCADQADAPAVVPLRGVVGVAWLAIRHVSAHPGGARAGGERCRPGRSCGRGR